MIESYEYGIIGGGLAGLCLAIRLAKESKDVALFEKQSYPFHRVCGEYISNETLPYLKTLGFDPFEFGASKIEKLLVSSVNGTVLNSDLDLGGFGISRYLMDQKLAEIAKSHGVKVHESCHIQDVNREKGSYLIKDKKNTSYRVKKLIGAQGKRSTLDSTLKRSYLNKRSPYLGIKYHIKFDQDADLIALHNFKNGYCGISKIENDTYCLCYICENEELKKHGSIEALEKNSLMQNSYLKDIFTRAEFLFEKPIAINEISFAKKSTESFGIGMVGDAAGMIAPLCGNGMAMAIHSSKLLADCILKDDDYLKSYSKLWEKQFAQRLSVGRNIQRTFGNLSLTDFTLRTVKSIPSLKNKLIEMTHGKEF
jgi:flavin-dependent dehydrogenase